MSRLGSAGLACVNLGVLYLKRGRAELAARKFPGGVASLRFKAQHVASPRLFLNLAHLARENGHWKRRHRCTEVIALAVLHRP